MEQCSGVDTPLTRDGMEKVSCGELLDESEASKVRRPIARNQLHGLGQSRSVKCGQNCFAICE